MFQLCKNQKVTHKTNSQSGLRQSVTALLLLLTCVFPLLEARIHPVEMVSQGPCKPVAESYVSQVDFIISPSFAASGVKYERVWHLPFLHTLSDIQPTKLPRQIFQEGDRLTSPPVRLLLISIQTSSER